MKKYFPGTFAIVLAVSLCALQSFTTTKVKNDNNHPLVTFDWYPVNAAGNPPFSAAEMISEANISQVRQLNFILPMLYCKADFKLLRNSTGVILVGM